MLITGGRDNPSTVSRYGKEGFIADFSSRLNTGRRFHGCTSFLPDDNERVNFNLKNKPLPLPGMAPTPTPLLRALARDDIRFELGKVRAMLAKSRGTAVA